MTNINTTEIIKQVETLLKNVGVSFNLIARETGKKTPFIGAVTKDDEEMINEMLIRNRVIYCIGTLATAPVPGDSIADKNEKILALSSDNISSAGGYEYQIKTVKRLAISGVRIAFKLEVTG